jgi:hypothetical protein
MRVTKVLKHEKTAKIIADHGEYANMIGLEETPTGLKARLMFEDGHREQVNVQLVKVLQEYELEKLIKDPIKRYKVRND